MVLYLLYSQNALCILMKINEQCLQITALPEVNICCILSCTASLKGGPIKCFCKP